MKNITILPFFIYLIFAQFLIPIVSIGQNGQNNFYSPESVEDLVVKYQLTLVDSFFPDGLELGTEVVYFKDNQMITDPPGYETEDPAEGDS